jgi:chromosome partitioning protein
MAIRSYNSTLILGFTMKIVSIISQKGGVGKTTLATALAVAAEADGKNTAVFDLDPQASATFWHDTREAQTPAVAAIPSSRLTHLLQAAKESGTVNLFYPEKSVPARFC